MSGHRGLRGRDRELVMVDRALRQSREGSTRLIIISGACGAGRTEVLRWAARRAAADGRVLAECDGRSPEPTPLFAPSTVDTDAGPSVDLAPEVVLWDDPPWEDPRFVHRLDEALRRTRATWVLTHRQGQAPYPAPRAAAVWVLLEPLPAAAIRDIAAEHWAARLGPRVSALLAVAGGNPGRLMELLAGLALDGIVHFEQGRAELVVERLPEITAARIRRTVAELAPPAGQLVRLAAMAGTRCDAAAIAHVLGTTVVDLVPALVAAIECGVLRADADHLAFSHDLVRQLVAESIPQPVRPAVAERIALVRRVGAAQPPGAIPAALAELTATELRIATLVRQDLTNQQIGRRLFLSPHTVNYHLRQIYRKLGVSSRVQLAALAWPEVDPGDAAVPARR